MLQNNFKVITETKKENSKSLEEIIEERRLLKIKLMLLQISDLDSDLKMLEKHQVTIPNLTLQDIFLTDYHVIYASNKK